MSMDPGPAPASVLYITYDGLLEPLGASQVLPYVEALRRRGFSIELLSFEKEADLAHPGRTEALAGRLAQWGVRWRRLAYHGRPSLPATAWDVLQGRRHVRRWAAAVHRAGRTGLVHARGYLPGMMALAGRQPPAVRLLFDMRGFWVDERIEGGYWGSGSVPVRLGRRLERRLLRDADHLILLTHRASEQLPELAGGSPVPSWAVIPTCVDLDRFSVPSDPTAARRKVDIDGGGPVLIHIGTLTGWYDGPATMRVARAFVEQTGGTFVILTRDVREARSMTSEAGLSARIETALPADVPTWLQAADAGLALVRPSPSKDASFPTKIGEYLATGLAVLTTPVGDMASFEDPCCLRLLTEQTEVEAASWIAEAIEGPERQARARAAAERHLGVVAGAQVLEEVYAALGVGADETGAPS
jgi:glycosyltransferase involved in cell wall biosynthesis